MNRSDILAARQIGDRARQLYDYHLAPPDLKTREGIWWIREELGDYLPPVSPDPIALSPQPRQGRA